jgi:hypothetical protein
MSPIQKRVPRAGVGVLSVEGQDSGHANRLTTIGAKSTLFYRSVNIQDPRRWARARIVSNTITAGSDTSHRDPYRVS